MPITTPHHQQQEMSGAMLESLTRELRARTPRAGAEHDITIQPVPMRTCYETMTRLHGPRDAVLDYAAFLFSEDKNATREPTPPLAIDEAQVDPDTGDLTLVLTRGTFTER